MSNGKPHRRCWRSITPNVFVLTAGVDAILAFGIVMFGLGAWRNRDEGFLKCDRPPSDYEAHVWYAIDYAVHGLEDNDVIFLGDSTCLCGVRTRRFEQLTGLKAYNLGSVGIVGPDGCGIILDHYLKHHPKPRAVVFCMCPWALGVPASATGPSQIRDQFLSAYAPHPTDASADRFETALRFVRQGARVLAGPFSKSAGGPFNEPIPGRNGLTLESLGKKIRDERGFFEHPNALPIDTVRREDRDLPPAVLPANRDAIRDLARLATENNVPLYFRLTPALGTDAESFDGLQSSLKQLYEECPQMIPTRPELVLYDGTFFGETLHLNGRGADRFTACVAEEMAGLLDVP